MRLEFARDSFVAEVVVKTHTLVVGLALVTALPLLAPQARPWGEKGHKVLSRIAESRLSDAARARVKEILGDQSLADVSNWADSIRKERRETAPWHYVNVQPGAEHDSDARDCGAEGCVVSATEKFIAVLKDKKAKPAERKEALMWVVHLVGDLHQPLHCSHASDRGGNDIKVEFEGTPTNLHSVWDTEIIERQHLDDAVYAEQLEADIADDDVAAWTGVELRGWIDESWKLAEDAAYRDARGKKIETGAKISREYLTTRTVVVDRRLKQAGVRLAKVLNDALGAP